MKIKVYLTKGEPITISEEQAKDMLNSSETLYALKDSSGKWNGDVIHKSHIVQMLRDYDAENEELRKNPRLEDPDTRPLSPEERDILRGKAAAFRPKFIKTEPEY